MIEKYQRQMLSGASFQDICNSVLEEPAPTNLESLLNPGNADFWQGCMTSDERKLAVVIKEISDRQSELATRPHFGVLINIHNYLLNELDKRVKARTKYNSNQYFHWFPASDGLIYGCQGACKVCQKEKEVSNEKFSDALIIGWKND